MRRVWMWCGSVVIALSVATLYAQTPALDIRMGLWEVTTATIGASQVVDPSRVSRDATGDTSVTKVCMTKNELTKTYFVLPPMAGCTRTIIANSPSVLEAAVACVSGGTMTSQVHLEALSPTSIKGTVNTASTGAGSVASGSKSITAKWLAAECPPKK